MKKSILIAKTTILASVVTLLAACASTPPVSFEAKPRKIMLTTAETILTQLTTEEKVAQLFIITPEQFSADARTAVTQEFSDTVAAYPVGGFILFARNIETPAQLRAFNINLRKTCSIPPLIATDEEGGRVARLARSEQFFLPQFESMMTIGATKNTENARGAGQIIGSYLMTYGFTLDFAPDADVNTNPNNIVIGNRAFGSNPQLVSDMVSAFLSGLHSTGMNGCLKHFPGHGDTRGDTHSDYVAVTKTWSELKTCELIPFVQNLSAADCIMVAHVTCTAVDKTYPASLSKALITDRLRGELGYQGVILTDALNMGAIEKNYGSGEASVLAFEAGNDILLMPKDFHAAYAALLNAVRSGRISRDRLDESVLRILVLKGY
ncbi:MAG: hypothetical protein IJ558_02785 [Treponema sp.]|nr:hypothetical protein [Treponema sp.]